MPVLDTGIFFAGRKEDARIKSAHDEGVRERGRACAIRKSVMPVLDPGIFLAGCKKMRGSRPRMMRGERGRACAIPKPVMPVLDTGILFASH